MPMLIFKILVLVGLIATEIAEYRISKREKMPVTVSASAEPKKVTVTRICGESGRPITVVSASENIGNIYTYRDADGKICLRRE